MLKLAVEANDIAYESLKGLEAQNEGIKDQQDEIAAMGDELNVADRKLKGIKSFFSHIGNQFRKDNSGEHEKARQKYEKEYAKQNFKNEAEKQKMQEEDMNVKVSVNNEELKKAAEEDAELLKQAKQESQQQWKSMKKGGESDGVFMGKFNFEENEVPGEQCEAENNLEDVSKHVKILKSKAEAMNDYVIESKVRISDLHNDLDGVKDRTVGATMKGEKNHQKGHISLMNDDIMMYFYK